MRGADEGIADRLRRSIGGAIGVAGFIGKAWLRLRDALRICGGDAVFSIEDNFDRARHAVFNSHNPVFAALAAAYHDLLQAVPVSVALAELGRGFAMHPLAAAFSPRFWTVESRQSGHSQEICFAR